MCRCLSHLYGCYKEAFFLLSPSPLSPRLSLTPVNHLRFFLAAVAALLLQVGTGWASPAPDGFVGLPWMAIPSEAKLVMLGREGVRLKQETPDLLVFTGGTYADRPVEHWELEFAYERFQRGTAFLTIPTGTGKDGKSLADQQFDDFFRAFKTKYGLGVSVGGEGETANLWKWTVPDPHTGNRSVISIKLSFKWSAPQVFKVQYASLPPEALETPKPTKAPAATPAGISAKTGDL